MRVSFATCLLMRRQCEIKKLSSFVTALAYRSNYFVTDQRVFKHFEFAKKIRKHVNFGAYISEKEIFKGPRLKHVILFS